MEKELYGCEWTNITVNDEIIKIVEDISEMGGQTLMDSSQILDWTPVNTIINHNEYMDRINAAMDNVDYDYNSDGANYGNSDDTNGKKIIARSRE